MQKETEAGKIGAIWNDGIRLELLALGVVRAIKESGLPGDYSKYSEVYRDLRIEFPTLSEQEIWEVIGLCVKVYGTREQENNRPGER